MTCHFVCGGGVTKSSYKSYTNKKRPKKGKENVTERRMARLFENLRSVK